MERALVTKNPMNGLDFTVSGSFLPRSGTSRSAASRRAVPGDSPSRAHRSCVEAQRIAGVFVVFLHSGLHDYLRLPRIDGLLSIRSKCPSVTPSSAGSKRDLTHLPNFQLSSLWPLGRCRCSEWPLCVSVVSTCRYQPRAQAGSTQPLWSNRQTHTGRSV